MGTQRRDFVQLTEYLDQTTGGVQAFPLVSAHQGLEGDPRAYIIVRGKAVGAKAQDLLGVASELLLEPRLDNKGRFAQLVLREKAGLEQNVVEHGNDFASTRLAAQSTVAGWAGELIGGISYLQYVRGLAAQVHDNWPQVLAQLEAIRAYAIHHAGALINLTGDDNLLADVAPAAGRFMAGLPTRPRPAEPWNQTLPAESEAFLIPTQVSYTCKAVNLYQAAGLPYNFNETGSLIVATHYLAATWLWDSVRVQGGAYGAFLDYDLASGQLSYCSYRDPGLLSTLDDFDKSAQFLAESETPQDTLTKSIVGTIGQIDAYMLPDAKGYTALYRHVLGISDEERQARRDRVLATSAEDLRQLADLLQVAAEEGRVAAVTSRAAAAAAQAQQPGLFDRVETLL